LSGQTTTYIFTCTTQTKQRPENKEADDIRWHHMKHSRSMNKIM